MALHFTATESTFSYFEALGKYLKAHGKPRRQARLSKVNYVYIQAVQMF
jgi:aconitase A